MTPPHTSSHFHQILKSSSQTQFSPHHFCPQCFHVLLYSLSLPVHKIIFSPQNPQESFSLLLSSETQEFKLFICTGCHCILPQCIQTSKFCRPFSLKPTVDDCGGVFEQFCHSIHRIFSPRQMPNSDGCIWKLSGDSGDTFFECLHY